MKQFYAHSRNPQGQRHRLSDHLKEVARLAKKFADKFDAGDLAYWAGLWHDVGKYHSSFQDYLRKCQAETERSHRGPDHKSAGALLTLQNLKPLSFLAAGHHGGLPNSIDLKNWLSEKSSSPAFSESLTIAKDDGLNINPQTKLKEPPFIKTPLDAEFFIRMLFSTLVDADFLDTESHFNPENVEKRVLYLPLTEFWRRFKEYQRNITGQAVDQLNIIRNEVYEYCLGASGLAPGFFRLYNIA